MEKGKEKKDDLDLWNDDLSPAEKLHHQLLFFSQGPVDGYLSGTRARDVFLHSRLPLTVLSQIWNLADVSNDNVLSCEEFVLAMHLIIKVKEGLPVPRRLPKHLVPTPVPVADIEEMSDTEREAYQNVFNKLNLKSIDAIQGRQLLMESKLSPEELSKIWDLSDVDRNGELDKDEWTVSCHLIRTLKKGVSLKGPVDVFKWIPQRLSPVSYQARKHRVDEYNRKKHHLMTQKEKRKTQIDNETRRLELLKKRFHLHKELFDVSKKSAGLVIPEEEFLLYKEKEENNIEKVEAIVYRLKKEHEKIRQETVKVILGEQGSLQEDARLAKLEQDEVKQRLLTTHTKATKDPDPFHQLYELRKELRKRSTLSEGEEPEVHFPFASSSPFDKNSFHPKFSGETIFVHPSPSVLNNNNSNHSNHANRAVLKDLCEFGEGFIDKWTDRKSKPDADTDSTNDSIFMSLNVPVDRRVWSGIKWGENMDTSDIHSLHIRLVDLKEEFEKLNEDTGGQLLFRNPDDYLARKKAQEEEEKLEKSKYHRRGQSDKRGSKGDKEYKRRSYAAPRDDSQQALAEYRNKRRSLNLDKRLDKAGDSTFIPDAPQKSNRRSLSDKKNKENELSVNTKESETFSPVSASSPRPGESVASSSKGSTTASPTTSSTSPSRPSTKRKAAPPPPQSPNKQQNQPSQLKSPSKSPSQPQQRSPNKPPQPSARTPTPPSIESGKADRVDSPSKQTTEPIVSPTNESKIPKFVGGKEDKSIANTVPSRPPRRKKSDGNQSFLHDNVEKENSKASNEEGKPLKTAEKIEIKDNKTVEKPSVDEVVFDNPNANLNAAQEDTLLESVIKELPSLKPGSNVEEVIVKTSVKSDLESVPIEKPQAEDIVAKTTDGVEFEIKPTKVNREKGKLDDLDIQTKIELNVKDTITPKNIYMDSDEEDNAVTNVNNKNIEEAEVDEPDGYLDHIKPVSFRKQAPVQDIDQAFEHIGLLSDIKKSKDNKDTVSIASDISSAGSEPPPLPESAPPPFAELLKKTPSLSEVTETMEVTESTQVHQVPNKLSIDVAAESTNGELSPVMSPISDLKSISMRMTSPTRDNGDNENRELTIDVGGGRKNLDYDSDLTDDDGKPSVVGTFTPGEIETNNIPTETVDGDGGVQLMSFTAKLHSPNSDQSGPDSAFEDMQSSMTSNDPLSSTMDDIIHEEFVVSEKVNKVETLPKAKDKNQFEDKSDLVIEQSSVPKWSESRAVPGTKDFVKKAQQFADVVQKPPNMRVKLKREISGPEDLTDEAYLKLEAERRAVINSSMMKKKGVDLMAQRPLEDDSQVEQTPTSPDEAVQEWRSEVSKRANIDWDDKPQKVGLYSQNVIQENGNTEAVDRESIANLSTTRKQWETILKTNDTPKPSPVRNNKEPPKQVRHWEVKLPTKSKVVPADVVKSRVESDSDSEKEGKMDETDSVNESAIEREIRLAMEREELLRREKQKRSEPEAGQDSEFIKSLEENNNKPTYEEMTEADRGSELQQREEKIQQELLEQKKREAAINGNKQVEDDTASESSREDENANESIIEREIRLQQERERELELIRKSTTMSKPTEPARDVEDVVVTETVVMENSEPVQSSPTSASTPTVSTPDNLSEADPTEVKPRISYEEAISNASHEGESLIARELREAREREEELANMRKRTSGASASAMSSPAAAKQSELNTVSKTLAKTKPDQSPMKPSYQNDVSPYKNERRQSQDSLSSHSTEKSQPKVVVTPKSNVKVTSFSDKLNYRTPERNEAPKIVKKRGETAIERDIRIARERENDLRISKGLPPLVAEVKVESDEEESRDEEPTVSPTKSSWFYGRSQSSSAESSIQKMASSRLQKEINKQNALENKYRDEGRIKSTSEEHVGITKYTEIKQDKGVPTKRNFSVNREQKVQQNGTPVETKPTTPTSSVSKPVQPKFNRTTSGGNVTFSYRESRHKAESKIEQELREMREREAELSSQRAGAGLVSPRNPDSPRSPASNSVENKRSQFEQTS